MKKILFMRENGLVLPGPLSTQLEAEGFTVEHATQLENDCHAWLDEVRHAQPDVILIEIKSVNYLRRFEFCQQLRLETTTENIPVILLGVSQTDAGDGQETASIGLHHMLEGLRSGANDYLTAPFAMPELAGKINTALRLKSSLEKARILASQLNAVNEELYQRNIQVEKELYIARQLQQSLLPPALLMSEDDESAPIFTKIHYLDEKLRISGIYLPCDALGGDLYDVLDFKNNRLGVSITDVSGHGVPAGFITAIFKTSLYRITHEMMDPSDVLFHLNNELFNIVKTGDYVTSIYAHIDLETMQVDCAGAGHPYPVFYQAATHAISRLQKNGTPLVWVPDIDYPKDTITMAPGDSLFLFTDGVSELKNPAGQMFGEERIESMMRDAVTEKIPYFTDHLIGTLSDYTEGAPLEDDISMVLIEAL